MRVQPTDFRWTVFTRNTVFNLLGQGLPLVVALLCLPIVVGGLGAERFGVLALTWTVLVNAGALDLGLGLACAHRISSALARGASEDVPRILATALVAEGLLGISLGVLVVAIAPALVIHVFDLPVGLQDEGLSSLQWIALAVPVVLLSNVLRAALYAAQRFDLVNAVIIPSSSSMYLLSMAGVLGGWPLGAIVALLVASKVVALAVLWTLARRHCPGLSDRTRLAVDRQTFRHLLRFGSWLTVSSVMVPLSGQFERLLIPALVSIAALTYYTVPSEAVSRAAILPVSMALTLFPAVSRFNGHEDPALTEMVTRPMKWLLLVTTPLLAFAGLFAHELLAAWMGTAFAVEAASALRVLAVAFYVAGFSHILRAVVQGLGRPDLKAKLDLANAGLLLALLFTMTPRFGLAGAAGAKLITSCTELATLFVLASRIAPTALGLHGVIGRLGPGVTVSVSFVVVAAIAAEWQRGSPLAYMAFGVLALLHTTLFWKWAGDAIDRHGIVHVLNWLGPSRRTGRLSPVDAEEPL